MIYIYTYICMCVCECVCGVCVCTCGVSVSCAHILLSYILLPRVKLTHSLIVFKMLHRRKVNNTV